MTTLFTAPAEAASTPNWAVAELPLLIRSVRPVTLDRVTTVAAVALTCRRSTLVTLAPTTVKLLSVTIDSVSVPAPPLMMSATEKVAPVPATPLMVSLETVPVILSAPVLSVKVLPAALALFTVATAAVTVAVSLVTVVRICLPASTVALLFSTFEANDRATEPLLANRALEARAAVSVPA